MNIWQIEDAFVARMKTAPAFPAGSPVYGTVDSIDWTQEGAPVMGAHVQFSAVLPSDQAHAALSVRARYEVDIYLNHVAASQPQRIAFQNLTAAALQSIAGWEYAIGCDARFAEPRPSAFDTTFVRVALAFTVPLMQAGFK